MSENPVTGWSNLKFKRNSKFVELDSDNRIIRIMSLKELLVTYNFFLPKIRFRFSVRSEFTERTWGYFATLGDILTDNRLYPVLKPNETLVERIVKNRA
jgi:hypothetical protein